MDNDSKILELQQKIAAKKKELGKAERFQPVTNCSVTINGNLYNLHVLDSDGLKQVACSMHVYEMAAKDLGFEPPMVAGYKPEDWVDDCMQKISILQKRAELSKLESAYAKLSTLLSNDKRTELEIQDMMKELGIS